MTYILQVQHFQSGIQSDNFAQAEALSIDYFHNYMQSLHYFNAMAEKQEYSVPGQVAPFMNNIEIHPLHYILNEVCSDRCSALNWTILLLFM